MFDFLTPLTAEDFKDLDKALFELNAKEWQTILNAIPNWKENAEIKELIHKIEAEAFKQQRAAQALECSFVKYP